MEDQIFKTKYLLILLTCFLYVSANTFFDVTFTRAFCIDHNPKLCSNLYCSVKRFRNNSNTFNLGCNVINSPKVWIRFTLYYKYGHTYKFFLFNMTKNLCEILTKDYKRGVDVDFLYTPIFFHSMPKPVACPFKGNYSLENLLATEFIVPPKVPAGDYRADVRAFNDKNETLVFPRIYFTVKAKGIADLAMG